MIDLFDLKKGEAKYYDKPQRFYVVRNNTNVPRITIKETYPSNFIASIDEDYLRKWGSNNVTFEKLVI